MVASMSERADTPLLNWSELGVSGLLPTGTVTLLLADVEGSTRLWETQPEEMTDAIARFNQVVCDVVAAHEGVRPVEQGEGDSFVAAFARASDAVVAALELQRAPLAPIRLRIGVHTGEVQLRNEGNYAGPTINRTARLRNLAHGGQTVLSATTSDLVVDRLPDGAWLTDLGTHPLRDLPRPERVVQLCHPDLRNDFPPLRVTKTVASQHLPVQLSRFVGRDAELAQVRELLAHNRLVTLTGTGGVGKTRLAVQIAARLAEEFADGIWYVDLAPITDPDVVPIAVARALELPDQPGRSTMDTLTRFVADRQMLLVLDNCEHLLDASAAMVVALLGAGPDVTVLATSREAIGVAGEVGWRMPSLSLADEAVELFEDRARRVRPDFAVCDDNAATVKEICTRLDGLPLAIELAAARVRALSLDEILDSLHDRFRLLTGGARTAVRRQQTLRASVDWSHALLTEPERVLFRRLAVFMGGFDLDAAQAVAGSGDVERFQVLDLLTLLVDKSLVVAEHASGATRFLLLETVRQYAQEKLVESGEADTVRTRHRDYYTAMAAPLDAPAGSDYEQRLEQAETEIDNLRAAFAWSLENHDIEPALALASSLQPLWQARGRVREGLAWFDAALSDLDVQRAEVVLAVRARALADRAVLGVWLGDADSPDQAQQALTIAREIDDAALLVRALTACGIVAALSAEAAGPYFAEAIGLARDLGDRWRLSQILAGQARAANHAADPLATRAPAEEGRDLADAIGDRYNSRICRYCLAWAQIHQGELASAATQLADLLADARAAHDGLMELQCLGGQGVVLALQGEVAAARAAAEAAVNAAAEVGGAYAAYGYAALSFSAMAGGDAAALQDAADAWPQVTTLPQMAALQRTYSAAAALAGGDLVAARRWADAAVSTSWGGFQAAALLMRARVAIAAGEFEQGERDSHEALSLAASTGAHLNVPDILESLAALAGEAGSHPEAARLFGAAQAIRQRMGSVRFKIYDFADEATVALRNTMGDNDFEAAWSEGAALSTEEAIAYAQRRHGERKRPASGWASLTPTERDVVRLVSEGLANNDIATRLFVSPRTVQSHLTHVYTKLGLSSRVQLAQEAARHV
ncbi:helix-turn-helix transcriptional regulator [Mycobacterium noviomagense]|uniref:Transcriptional regulator n=1 Tax=Mycobacterium noviomagense TaxID=459858 RepID=A0A7I7PBY5_9MYCO|nr:LuxR family transcriptional regulator [Mycobacterium noviomagense]ORB12172.1 LuxR family transcriptional regulator [Mycobacterium noviomagense]BBY06124.1 transcriptional regulator [Mycobacterium noviomagense]